MTKNYFLVIFATAILTGPMVHAQSFSLPLPPISQEEALFGIESANESATESAQTDEQRAANLALAQLRYQRYAESICGFSDLQDVELYDGTLGVTKDFVADHQSSTGQVQWRDDLTARYGQGAGNVNGARWCSGTMISENLFLTAGHCFDPQDDPFRWQTPARLVNGVKELLPAEELALEMVVNFNYQVEPASGAIRVPDVYPVEELVEYRLGGFDYAILRLGPDAKGVHPGKSYGTRGLRSDVVSNGALLTIIQHPQGMPKKIEAGSQTNVAGQFLSYGDIDTLGGSSGSGVLNADGEIVAVHTNGGCTQMAGANLAVTLNHIARHSAIVN